MPMSESPFVFLRPQNDDFLFSSLISHHEGGAIARFFTAFLLAAFLAGCQAETAPAPHQERLVQVQRVSYESSAGVREFAGTVRARYETDLGFRVAGKMVARVVNVGDRVRAGDVVARLDAEDLGLQVESANADLAAARSSLSHTAADLHRYEILKERGFAPVAELDRRRTANDEAAGRLARAQRSLDLARNQFAYAELKADADGIITATLAEPGQVVSIGQPVVRLARKGEKEAVISLPETWLDDVRHATATVTLWSSGNRRYRARLRELSPQADPATRTYAARFTILDADDAVAFGMTTTVALEQTRDAPVARLPLAAVLNRGEGPAVYVVDRGVLSLKPVAVAAFTETAALVSSGVDAGDTVVILGVQKLEAGQKVRVVSKRD